MAKYVAEQALNGVFDAHDLARTRSFKRKLTRQIAHAPMRRLALIALCEVCYAAYRTIAIHAERKDAMRNNKHTLLMLACCLVPLAAIGVVYLFHAGAGSALFYGLVLLCPILHFVMMRGMMGGHAHHNDHLVEAVIPRTVASTDEVQPRQTGV